MTFLLMVYSRCLRLASGNHEDQISDRIILDGFGLPYLDVCSGSVARFEETVELFVVIRKTRRFTAAVELAKLENSIFDCLLVGRVRNVSLVDQIIVEGGEAEGVNLQYLPDASFLSSMFGGGHADDDLVLFCCDQVELKRVSLKHMHFAVGHCVFTCNKHAHSLTTCEQHLCRLHTSLELTVASFPNKGE